MLQVFFFYYYFLNNSGTHLAGLTSLNLLRWKCSLSPKGTVQSKIVLQDIPTSRIEGENSGDWEGSSDGSERLG